eukprot:s3271_g16.t1
MLAAAILKTFHCATCLRHVRLADPNGTVPASVATVPWKHSRNSEQIKKSLCNAEQFADRSRTQEWYEFGIYGFLAVNLQVVFFHKSNVFTWVGYTVTFVLRPVGGLLNGWLADRFGRRPAVLHSLVGMLVATVGQGLLPTSACCGETCGTVGLVLLLILRALQGLSAGGELGPIVSYFAETAPSGWKRTSTGLLTSTAGVGFLMANLVVALTVNLLGTEEMNRWGTVLLTLFLKAGDGAFLLCGNLGARFSLWIDYVSVAYRILVHIRPSSSLAIVKTWNCYRLACPGGPSPLHWWRWTRHVRSGPLAWQAIGPSTALDSAHQCFPPSLPTFPDDAVADFPLLRIECIVGLPL